MRYHCGNLPIHTLSDNDRRWWDTTVRIVVAVNILMLFVFSLSSSRTSLKDAFHNTSPYFASFCLDIKINLPFGWWLFRSSILVVVLLLHDVRTTRIRRWALSIGGCTTPRLWSPPPSLIVRISRICIASGRMDIDKIGMDSRLLLLLWWCCRFRWWLVPGSAVVVGIPSGCCIVGSGVVLLLVLTMGLLMFLWWWLLYTGSMTIEMGILLLRLRLLSSGWWRWWLVILLILTRRRRSFRGIAIRGRTPVATTTG